MTNTTSTAKIKRVPTLRFKEFEGEWEEKRLLDIATFQKGKSISKSDIVENGKLECIRYGELYTVYNELIENIVSRTNLEEKDLVLSNFNDVIIPSSGETILDIATASCVLKSNIALGGDLNIIRSDVNGVFLAFYLNNKKKKDIAKLAQGSSVIHLYNKHLKTLKLNLPKESEQQKIASFLSAVDEKIQQLQDKKQALQQFKKGVMQQLFSQQLRFKPDPSDVEGEGGKAFREWEEKRLGEIADNISYGMNSASTNFDGSNKYIRITDIDDASRKFEPKPLTSPKGELGSKYLVKKGDILFARTGASVGKSYLYSTNDGKVYFAGFLIRFSIKEADPFFIFSQTLTSRFQKWVKVMSMRSGQPGINAEEYKSYRIKLPSLQEQQKIANYLSSIDEKIEKVQAQIEQSQVFKKGLLQQLFV